ncbi:MAG: hypothetical protein NT058_00015, partial [Candidatus Portnoybacteria bacterium]|nr:hypothetical protein [Candidatus Portnoybacteria bacterium]
DDKIQELSLARKTLAENGFVQLNNGTLILPKAPLTDKQIQRINEAGLRIPLRLEYSGDITRDFKGMSLSIKLELFSNEAIELIREFFNNKCRFKVDNDPPKANVLFEALTIGFEQGGYYKFSAGYTREYNFKYPKDRDFAIEIITHRHDGYSGLQYSSWIDLVPIKEMVEITGFDPHKGGYNSESQNSGT